MTVPLTPTQIKQAKRAAKEAALAAKQLALPDKRYGVIVADPPWCWEPYSRETGMDRAADNHYVTAGTEEIAVLPVSNIAADDSVLFLWAISSMLPDALYVMHRWGFAYKTAYVWVKDRIGLGYWARSKHEHLLIGTRGHVPAPAPGTQWASVIEAPVRKHSEKPDAALEMIENYYPSLPKMSYIGAVRRGWDGMHGELKRSPQLSFLLEGTHMTKDTVEHKRNCNARIRDRAQSIGRESEGPAASRAPPDRRSPTPLGVRCATRPPSFDGRSGRAAA